MIDPLLIDVPEHVLTERLLLRPPRPGDGAMMCEAVLASLDELRPWMPWARQPTTPEASEAHARRMHARFALREDLTYLMLERDGEGGGRLLGSTGLHRIDWSVPRFEIGYWRRSDAGGRGLVTEAVQALAHLAFETLRAERVEIRMDARNSASVKVAERAGFSFEGLLRHETRAVDGSLRDTSVYARVRGAEPPRQQASVEQGSAGG